jgi:hypothetical protein
MIQENHLLLMGVMPKTAGDLIIEECNSLCNTGIIK